MPWCLGALSALTAQKGLARAGVGSAEFGVKCNFNLEPSEEKMVEPERIVSCLHSPKAIRDQCIELWPEICGAFDREFTMISYPTIPDDGGIKANRDMFLRCTI